MAALTNYLENKLLDFVLRGQAFVPPTTVYFALYTVAPADAGGGTEVTGGGYLRVARACTLAAFSGTQGSGTTAVSSGTLGTIYNNADIQFPDPVGANWGTVVAMGVLDASTGGNLLMYGAVFPNKTINNGDAPAKFAASAWSLQLDD